MDDISEILNDPKIHSDNREWMLRFDHEMYDSGRDEKQRAKALLTLKLLSGHLGEEFTKATKAKLEDFSEFCISKGGETDASRHLEVLGRFYGWLYVYDEGEMPEMVPYKNKTPKGLLERIREKLRSLFSSEDNTDEGLPQLMH
jgi:hypothetical protein